MPSKTEWQKRLYQFTEDILREVQAEECELGLHICELRESLKECADELEKELIAKYGDVSGHPDLQRRLNRDMGAVRRARKLLAG